MDLFRFSQFPRVFWKLEENLGTSDRFSLYFQLNFLIDSCKSGDVSVPFNFFLMLVMLLGTFLL
jgi:hypothetical protein